MRAINNSLNISWGDDQINLSKFRKAKLADLVLEHNDSISEDQIENGGKELLELFESCRRKFN